MAAEDTLRGRLALVTGASRGIGSAIAEALAAAGCDVAIHYRKEQGAADEVRQRVSEMGVRAETFAADLTNEAAAEALAAEVAGSMGKVDILVNNAGMTPGVGFADLRAEHWHQTIAANLTSAFLLSQAVLPGMRERHWGRLIFLSSVAAQTGGVIGPHYAASKAGMLGLMHSYASLLAKEGVTSNAIAPALIETDMVRNNPRAKADLIPVGRFGTADECAQVAVMLASNAYITGQTINVNGGWYMS